MSFTSRYEGAKVRVSGAKRLALLACVALPLAVGGCKTTGLNDFTASIGPAPDTTMPSTPAAIRTYTEAWGRRYDSTPGDKVAAIAYARGLRAQTQYSQAVAVLEQTAMKQPNDMEVLGAYGKALADAGRLEEAADVLKRAHTPDRPNWSILSAQGSVADQMGDHASAQAFYTEALKINPGEPSVLSNLGLSYALAKQLDKAEAALRQASADPKADTRVRQNLALVLSLEGKFTEAEQVGARDLSPEQASANVATIRRMIAQSNTWRDIQKPDGQTTVKPRTLAARPAARVAPTTAAATDSANWNRAAQAATTVEQ